MTTLGFRFLGSNLSSSTFYLTEPEHRKPPFYHRAKNLPSWAHLRIVQHNEYKDPSIIPGEGNGTPLQYSCLENPMDGEAWQAAVHGVAEDRTRLERLHFHFSLSCIGERNGNLLQCSCLENPRDGGAQWAAVYGVTQSRTRLK